VAARLAIIWMRRRRSLSISTPLGKQTGANQNYDTAEEKIGKICSARFAEIYWFVVLRFQAVDHRRDPEPRNTMLRQISPLIVIKSLSDKAIRPNAYPVFGAGQ
jgi:hypothetical protein